MNAAHVTTHVVVNTIPVTLAMTGILVIVGCSLALARRYPVVAFTGTALLLAGWLLGFAQEWRYHDTAVMVVLAVFAAWAAIRLWSQRATVR